MAKKSETVLVMGASPNPDRYAFKATTALKNHGHTVVPFGIRKGEISGIQIVNELPESDIDTVTLYLGPARQPEHYNYLMALKPKRIIFNPGTENSELAELANKNGIETENACTLVLLSLDAF
ncbi:MAG: CoA-binding protein [Salibacteraceae bacterium]